MNVRYPQKCEGPLSVAVGAGAMLLSSQVRASKARKGQELPFDEAQLYFELNHTDGDLGFHGLIDGDAWKSLEIEDRPSETLLMNVWIRGSPAAGRG